MQRNITITKEERVETKAGWKRVVYDGEIKYGFFELKKDKTPTRAFAQYKQFELRVGSSCPAEVEEEKSSFIGKEGKPIPVIYRTILYWVGDEHGVPYMSTDPQQREIVIAPTEIERLHKRISALEDAVFGTEKEVKVEDGINPEDLPF